MSTRTIKCACGNLHELSRGDSICDVCEAAYNAGGDRLRGSHCTEDHYEAADYAQENQP